MEICIIPLRQNKIILTLNPSEPHWIDISRVYLKTIFTLKLKTTQRLSKSCQSIGQLVYQFLFMPLNKAYSCVRTKSKCAGASDHRYLLPLVIIGGLLGNALNLRVLTRRELRSPTTTFLRAMAAADALVLALQLPHMLALLVLGSQFASRPFNLLLALYYPYIRCVRTNM